MTQVLEANFCLKIKKSTMFFRGLAKGGAVPWPVECLKFKNVKNQYVQSCKLHHFVTSKKSYLLGKVKFI
jgi:hypothetical protein